MKTLKLVTLSLLALTVAGDAFSQTVVRITGSTAFRKQTNAAMLAVFDPGTLTYAWISNSAGFSGASKAIFKGKIGGADYIFKSAFSGSTGGIADVAQGRTNTYLPDSTTTSAAGIEIPSSPTPTTVSEIAQCTMMDTFQDATVFRDPPLDIVTVGVVAYGFAINGQAPASITNITSLQAQALYRLGRLPVAMFTGNPADRTTLINSTYATRVFGGPKPAQIYAIGRNPDSGTRVATFAETGVGTTTTIQQFEPVVSGTAVTDQNLFPATTFKDIPYGLGESGYSSGGILAGLVRNTTLAGIGGYYITYMGTGDLTNAIAPLPGIGGAAPARALTWNGESFSVQNVQEGKYTFWTYQHLGTNPGASTEVKAGATALASKIILEIAEIPFDTMQVSRATDGGVVVNDY